MIWGASDILNISRAAKRYKYFFILLNKSEVLLVGKAKRSVLP